MEKILNPFILAKKFDYILKQAWDTVRYINEKRILSTSISGIKSINFVCYGNICRSAFAEYYARKVFFSSGVNIEITSSGLNAKQSETSPENAVIAARYFGVDLSGHKPSLVTADMVNEASVIAGMHYFNYTEFKKIFPRMEYKFFLLKHLAWPEYMLLNIPDPFGKPLNDFVKCFREISHCIDILALRLS
jgi:protein-tyrosine phosphatase